MSWSLVCPGLRHDKIDIRMEMDLTCWLAPHINYSASERPIQIDQRISIVAKLPYTQIVMRNREATRWTLVAELSTRETRVEREIGVQGFTARNGRRLCPRNSDAGGAPRASDFLQVVILQRVPLVPGRALESVNVFAGVFE